MSLESIIHDQLSSRFYSNSEAFASELLLNLADMYLRYYNIYHYICVEEKKDFLERKKVSLLLTIAKYKDRDNSRVFLE